MAFTDVSAVRAASTQKLTIRCRRRTSTGGADGGDGRTSRADLVAAVATGHRPEQQHLRCARSDQRLRRGLRINPSRRTNRCNNRDRPSLDGGGWSGVEDSGARVGGQNQP